MNIRNWQVVVCLLLSSHLLIAQNKISIGLEQDFLPYLTGGYYANVWVGQGHIRGRVLMAHVRKPDFMIPKAFTQNTVTAYALVADYFLKVEWKGPWISAGVVNWQSSIQNKERTAKTSFDNWLLNGSIGYNWTLYQHFYIGPWAGMHLRVGGDRSVVVGTNSYKPPLLNPEASLKVGWYFQGR